jgi:hypothetical protein
VTGTTGEPFDAHADDAGNLKECRHAGQNHDWVLILMRRGDATGKPPPT